MQIRAYLTTLPYVPPIPPKTIMMGNGRPRVEMEIKNTGQSPAREVNYIAAILIRSTELKETDPFPLTVHPSARSAGITIAAGGAFPYNAILTEDFSREDFRNAITNKDTFVYLCARIFYKDVFGKSRLTTFCSNYVRSGAENMADEIVDLGHWIMAKCHNHAD